ncbi:LPXTG cell wall anchor domain-containing protein [Pedococcus sp. 2YAF34]|uniref:LPXTG cell wall anchor domain-containing protein n=1 Tax=Pedococcus sp. 2YAF34 TaxID=3233032 RepID=UPI003F97E79C
MPAARFRLSAAAAVAVLGAGLFLAGPASAAPGTTIKLDPSDVVMSDQVLNASGTCAARSTAAVLTVSQNGTEIARESVKVDGTDLSYSADLDVSKGDFGAANVTVDCFRYDEPAALGTASAQFLLATDLLFDEIDVTVSPYTVAIGSKYTITGACAPGTTTAEVLAGVGENDEPFLDEVVTPAADGTVTYNDTLTAGEFVDTGDALAIVVCGDPSNPDAVGAADFTITAAPASAIPVAVPGAAPAAAPAARPELAATGSDNGPLAGLGGALLLLGVGAHVLRRRADLKA